MSIRVENLCFVYEPGTAYEKEALKDVSFSVEKGEMVALIGHTGSGKSTLIMHLNGLNRPSSGKVFVDGADIFEKKENALGLCTKVGLVFQYPEYQLFETTVYREIAFGPKNLKLSDDEIDRRVRSAIACVGLDESIFDSSPFDHSGGQKRRIAIADILAMEPEFLVLDEPCAGLDPESRERLLQELRSMRDERGIGIILVSHSMQDVARYCDRVLAMEDGRLVMDMPVREAFEQQDILTDMGLFVPEEVELFHRLRDMGYKYDKLPLNPEEAAEELKKMFFSGERHDS